MTAATLLHGTWLPRPCEICFWYEHTHGGLLVRYKWFLLEQKLMATAAGRWAELQTKKQQNKPTSTNQGWQRYRARAQSRPMEWSSQSRRPDGQKSRKKTVASKHEVWLETKPRKDCWAFLVASQLGYHIFQALYTQDTHEAIHAEAKLQVAPKHTIASHPHFKPRTFQDLLALH